MIKGLCKKPLVIIRPVLVECLNNAIPAKVVNMC